MSPKIIAAVLAATLISFSAWTTSNVEAAEFTVGIGAGAAPDYEGSQDYTPVPTWNLKAADLWGKPTYVQVLNTNLRSNFLNDEHLRLGLSGQYVAERSDVDNNQVDALDDADESVMLGALGGYDFQLGGGRIFGLGVNGRYDVANSNGYLITPEASYAAPLAANWAFAGKLSTTWASEDYMSNYFGINQANANQSGLDQFDADSGIKDVSVDLSVTWRFAQSWSLTALGQYKRLLGDAADSPITDDEGDANQLFAGLLVNLHF